MYTFGKSTQSWHNERAQTVTFVVTDDCNLRCKYCYITHKQSGNVLSLDTAKTFINLLLKTDELKYAESVILEFIGGEPMLEAKLIDQIVDYFKITAYEMGCDWYWNYRISICTNGVNYQSDEVQKLIQKNIGKISITISIDGTQEKHDSQRVFPDGSGSYSIIDNNIDLWLSQFRPMTKVTFASDDLIYLYDSIIHLWKRGIKEVNANVVFEDVWKTGDDKILEEQLKKLADYVIDHELYNQGYYCSFFDDKIGYPYDEEDFNATYCGAGKMIALSPNGDIYPCIRYYGYSLNNHKQWVIGDVVNGLDMDKVRPFVLSTNSAQSDDECLNCQVAVGCGMCQGFNYDDAPIPTNFYRAKYICKMHKARVRANRYYFAKLFNLKGIENENQLSIDHSLYFLMSRDYVNYCSYSNDVKTTSLMSKETLMKGLNYAEEALMSPVFVHSRNGDSIVVNSKLSSFDILHIVAAPHYSKAIKIGYKRVLPVYRPQDILDVGKTSETNVILSIREQEISSLCNYIQKLLRYAARINVNITDLDKTFQEDSYLKELRLVKDLLVQIWQQTGVLKEVNILTDIIFLNKHDHCNAGVKNFVLSPNGEFYPCCAQVENKEDCSSGNLDTGLTYPNQRWYRIEQSNVCNVCEAYHCPYCVEINRKSTNEFCVPPSFQCRKSHIERKVSYELKELLKDCTLLKNSEFHCGYSSDILDPIKVFIDQSFKNRTTGYYQFEAGENRGGTGCGTKRSLSVK